MDDNNGIVYLETRRERWKGRWQAMSRIARMGIVSTVFGLIGLVTCFLLSFIPFLSLPFSMIGLLIGLFSLVAGFLHNLRRDGFWFPLAGTVISLLGLAIGLGAYADYNESQKKEKEDERQAEIDRQRQQFVGRWLKGNGDSQQSLEMTEAGSLLWKGPDSGSEAEETVARFQFRESSLVISFGESGPDSTRSMVRYRVDTSRKDKLLLSDRKVVSGNASIDMSGSWNRVGPPRVLTAAEKEIADYRSKLERFQEQQLKIDELISRFEEDRMELIEKLRPYEEGQARDERWSVWARELNTLVGQIRLLKDRKPRLANAIVRLDVAIGRLTRQAELDQTGMDTGQLEELLMTTDRLDEELKSMETAEAVEEFILQQVIEDEIGKEKTGQ